MGSPIQIILGLALIIHNLGYSALVAVGVLVFAVPLQAVIVQRMIGARRGAVNLTDKRVRLTQEILQGMKLIALFGWQDAYTNRILGLRRDELVRVREMAFFRGLTFSIVYFVPVLAAVLSFITYSLTGHPLNPAIIFSSLQVRFSLSSFLRTCQLTLYYCHYYNSTSM